MTTTWARRGAVLGGVTLVLGGAAACNDQGNQSSTGGGSSVAAATSTTPAAEVAVSVPDGATDVTPASVITVKATTGRLATVTIASQDGKRTVAGKVGSNGVWASTGRLVPKTTYRVTATARNGATPETTTTTTFTTMTPEQTVGYTVTPDGWTVGSGMPVQVNFDRSIPKAYRAAVESQLTVVTTPVQAGGWAWVGDATLMYRPQKYWAAGTAITVTAPLAGTQVGPAAYLMEDNGAKLTVGTQRVLHVDLVKHTMTDTENGQLVRTFLISGGRPGAQFETRNGTKVIQDKYDTIIMDSSTFGIGKMDPQYYRTPVQDAMRVTDSGEFLHSAPWSVGQQGHANVSHGCINMSPGDAKWLFDRVQYGDVVENTGSSIPLRPDEAGISAWLYTWPQWQAMSALAGAPAAGSTATRTPSTTTSAATTAPAAATQPSAATPAAAASTAHTAAGH